MSEELIPEQVSPLEEQMNLKLVTGNVTEAIIATLRETYLPLKINGMEDKETYLLVKEGRKRCKELRVAAKKICEDGREDAVAIQKAWVAKQKEVTGRIAEVEDYLEKQEKEYEAEIAKEKEARKRKQEEQLIIRQQALSGMGALYFNGQFVLGDVSFDFSAIKESEEDIWQESILPKYQEEHNKIEAERIEQDRLKAEKEAELKRQQEELEQKRKELEEKEAKLKKNEASRIEKLWRGRLEELRPIGWNGQQAFAWYDESVIVATYDQLISLSDEDFGVICNRHQEKVKDIERQVAEEERKEQERQELQNKRYAEMFPYKEYGESIEMDNLWLLSEEVYIHRLGAKRDAFDRAEEKKAKEIAEKAAKAERERIEEEQRQADVKRRNELRTSRKESLKQYNYVFTALEGDFADFTDAEWTNYITHVKAEYDENVRKQEEERKAEELAKAGDKEKWGQIEMQIKALEIVVERYPMRSSQYRKKAAILREKLEEIKAL